MFWDKISPLYDIFESIYNGKVYTGTGKKVAELIDSSDEVLECACGKADVISINHILNFQFILFVNDSMAR